MTTLTGSDKQITWAEDLRTQALQMAEDLIQRTHERIARNPNSELAKAKLAEQERQIEALRQISDATWFINRRSSFCPKDSPHYAPINVATALIEAEGATS